MSYVFDTGIIYYSHSLELIITEHARLLEYIEFVIGMHRQGYWGDISPAESELSSQGLLFGTSVRSEYDLVEEFESLGQSIIIFTDIDLCYTIINVK